MKLKNAVLLIILLIAGIIAGGLIASATQAVPALSWLSYAKTIGLSAAKPAVLDLSVLKLAFGCELNINVAQIVCLIAALIFYKRLK